MLRIARRRFCLALALASVPHSVAAAERPAFSFFYAFDCPHCEKAKPFVAKLEKDYPRVRFESWEIKRDPEGRRRFVSEVKRLKLRDPGVPLFVCGNEYVMGWLGAETERCVRKMIARCQRAR